MKFWERTEGIPGIYSSAVCDELGNLNHWFELENFPITK